MGDRLPLLENRWYSPLQHVVTQNRSIMGVYIGIIETAARFCTYKYHMSVLGRNGVPDS